MQAEKHAPHHPGAPRGCVFSMLKTCVFRGGGSPSLCAGVAADKEWVAGDSCPLRSTERRNGSREPLNPFAEGDGLHAEAFVGLEHVGFGSREAARVVELVEVEAGHARVVRVMERGAGGAHRHDLATVGLEDLTQSTMEMPVQHEAVLDAREALAELS